MKQFLLFIAVLFSTSGLFAQNGQVWHQLNFPGGGNYGAICPIDENLVYGMMDNGMFHKSIDGGLSWTVNDLGTTEDFFDLAFFDANLGFAVGTNGTILKTVDGGTTWNSLPTGTTEDLFSMAMISLNDIWAVGHHGTVLHSTDGGNTWVLDNSLSTEMLNSVKFNGNIGYIAGNNATLLHTSDYGATWTPVSLSTTGDFFSLSVTENNTQFLAGNVGENYYEYSGFLAIKTTDNINWVNYPVFGIATFALSSLYFQNDTLGFHLAAAAALCNCSAMNIHKTTDAGQTWSLSYCSETHFSDSPFMAGYSDIAFVNDTIGYAYVSSKLFKTTNGGDDWQDDWCDSAFGVEAFNIRSFTIYPNPSRGNQIKIAFKNTLLTAYSVEIVDLRGKQVFYAEKVNGNSIDISGLGTGMYFLNILKDGKTIGSEKLIKSN